jgi:hypothetical protein
MWFIQLTYGGVRHYHGHFYDEIEASHHADIVLRHIGADERCNWLLNGTRTGYGRRGGRPEANRISGLTARVEATRKSPWIGVNQLVKPGQILTWRGRVFLADCLPEEPCVAHMRLVKCTCKDCMPDTPCRVAQRRGVRCKCKQVQKNLYHPDTGGYFKTDEEAARRYNQVVHDNNLHKPPYSKALNPRPGHTWSSPCPAWAEPKSALTLGP